MEHYENIIEEIFNLPDLDECVVEYYPHVNVLYESGGSFQNETNIDFKFPNYSITDEDVTEYVYHDKKLIFHHNTNDREYTLIQQRFNKIQDGLFIVSKIDYIDPNRFPILCQYYDKTQKHIKTYFGKYLTVFVITENDINYLKISFNINYDEHYKKKIIKNLKEVISLIQQKQSP